MLPITESEILTRDAYEAQRDAVRRRIMVEKSRRRVAVGDHCTVHFESRDTMLYQVHEMLRAENSWTRPGAAADELEAYNPLVPGDGKLSATLMFEWAEPAERGVMLQRLVGVERHVFLHVGPQRIPAEFDALGLSPTKVSSVHYVKWTLDAAARAALAADGTVVRLEIDHPAYTRTVVVSEDVRAAIASDPL